MKDTVRVAVVMGGPSAEHEISLRSGHGVVTALGRRGWPVQEIVIPRGLTLEAATRYTRQALELAGTTVVFIALHGPFGEDGTIQRLCEELRLAYTGSDPHASRLGLDKVASRRRFEQAGLPVPRWFLIDRTDHETLLSCLTALRFPIVVKPTNQGSSIGVSIAAHHAELQEAVREAARYDAHILLEEFVRGRELTVGILGREALPLVEIRPINRFFDYAAKYTAGQTTYAVPAVLDPAVARQVQAAGLRAHDALGCRHFSRVDLILNEAQQPVVLELNTIPGLTATSLLPKAAACVGIPYDELCEQLVRMAWNAGQPAEPVHVGVEKEHE